MAQSRYGRVSDYQLRGRTRGLGSLSAEGGAPVAWEGVVSAGGYDGSPVVVGGSAAIQGSLGATFILDSPVAFRLTLPAAQSPRNFRFIMGVAVVGQHILDAGSGIIHGGIVSGNSVPPAVFASGAQEVRFGSLAVPGDRISLMAHNGLWYISEGVCSVDGGISFA